jgi:uncharacterized membrane protein YkoI
MHRFRLIPAALAAAIVLGGAGATFASEGEHETDDHQQISAVMNAKTSLAQAIATAERETGGKAFDTGVEIQDGVMAYEVEVAKDNTVQNVLVALDSGKIIKVMPGDTEHDDHDDDDEHEHEHEHDKD